MTEAEPQTDISIYEAAGGGVEVRLTQDTVWLSQAQMAGVFDTSIDNIGLHLKNIYADDELDEAATTEDFSVVRQEGKRKVQRRLKHYNLDAIISVGYRVSSKRAVAFRQWATALLRQHLTQGYTLNRQRLESNARELEAALQLVRHAAQSPELLADTGRGLVDIVTRYANTFLLLQRYDEGLLTEPQQQHGGQLPTPAEARHALARLKAELVQRGEATDLFARDRTDGLAALLGNLDQTVFGEPAYPTVEAKAAHLLYFVIKNHPFRRQQAQRRLPVRRLPEPQCPPAGRRRPAGHQRHRPGRAGLAGGRVGRRAEGHHDSPDHEHAGSAARMNDG